jgi:60 kDa SS-A/Ro ribonucleoprotein
MDKAARMSADSTDCALPMLHATESKMDMDAFIVITDNETWAGTIQPIQALQKYRIASGKPDAALIVMGMTATGFSIADPNDARNLDVVGFDANVPALVTDFIRGESAGIVVDTEDE